jgi:gas vesicle protein
MKKTQKSVLIGFAVGTIVTAAATLLSTPKSGRELRKDIKDSTNKLKLTMMDVKKEGISLKEQIIQVSKEGVDAFKEVATDLKEDIKTWRKEIEPNIDHIKGDVETIQDTVSKTQEKTKKEPVKK